MTRTPLRVLIIEDSVADTDLLVRELRQGGYEPEYERVDVPDQMRDAITRAKWQVALVDHAMPQFSAPQALQIWREAGIDQPFIIVSDLIPFEIAVEMMKAGAHDFVMKMDLTRLVPAIRRELRDADARAESREVQKRLVNMNRELESMVAQLQSELSQSQERLRSAGLA